MRIATFKVKVWDEDGRTTVHEVYARDRADCRNKVMSKGAVGFIPERMEILNTASYDRRKAA